MIDIQALRRSRGLTLTDLAFLSGIPARTLAELEHGFQSLNDECRLQLSRVLNVPPQQLDAPAPAPARALPGWVRYAITALLVACAALLIEVAPLLDQPLAAASSRAAAPTATGVPARARRALLGAAQTPTPTARPTATPVPPSPPPRFSLAADGPHGCPLAPGAGAVVLTQGYDEGTHAPASIWGGIDLAIDLDRDGESEPASTQGQPIAATHAGVAHVYLGSWPAGNYVRVTDEQRGWSSAYAHLDSVAVADGQAVATGALLGTVGSSGMASGPHLHYEVWHGSTNVDPTGLVECR